MENINNKSSSNRKKIIIIALAVIVIAAIVFVSMSIRSKAASSAILFEAESANLSGKATVGSHEHASGGKYIYFSE